MTRVARLRILLLPVQLVFLLPAGTVIRGEDYDPCVPSSNLGNQGADRPEPRMPFCPSFCVTSHVECWCEVDRVEVRPPLGQSPGQVGPRMKQTYFRFSLLP